MATVLLDTDVVSFLFKGDSRGAAYAPLLRGNRLALSFMTVAELFSVGGDPQVGSAAGRATGADPYYLPDRARRS
jgi:hypothetical protein